MLQVNKKYTWGNGCNEYIIIDDGEKLQLFLNGYQPLSTDHLRAHIVEAESYNNFRYVE